MIRMMIIEMAVVHVVVLKKTTAVGKSLLYMHSIDKCIANAKVLFKLFY